jgi:hypothetical protein
VSNQRNKAADKDNDSDDGYWDPDALPSIRSKVYSLLKPIPFLVESPLKSKIIYDGRIIGFDFDPFADNVRKFIFGEKKLCIYQVEQKYGRMNAELYSDLLNFENLDHDNINKNAADMSTKWLDCESE